MAELRVEAVKKTCNSRYKPTKYCAYGLRGPTKTRRYGCLTPAPKSSAASQWIERTRSNDDEEEANRYASFTVLH